VFGFRRPRPGSGPRQPRRRQRHADEAQRGAPPATLKAVKLTDLELAAHESAVIPGMMSVKCAQMLYSLCYMQTIPGHVVEIGSWQGYSTSFLARAVRDSHNGRLFAIDHFRGNVGKEDHYVVGEGDLSDLRANFEANLKRVDLWDHVTLLDMPNDQAVPKLREALGAECGVRFLLIDGDHTKEGVQKDINLFFPLLVPQGAIVVFDDFSTNCPGLVEACDELLATRQVQRRFSYRNTLVVML
jgi:predicted O-methyltransferase YrrM